VIAGWDPDQGPGCGGWPLRSALSPDDDDGLGRYMMTMTMAGAITQAIQE